MVTSLGGGLGAGFGSGFVGDLEAGGLDGGHEGAVVVPSLAFTGSLVFLVVAVEGDSASNPNR